MVCVCTGSNNIYSLVLILCEVRVAKELGGQRTGLEAIRAAWNGREEVQWKSLGCGCVCCLLVEK